MIGSNNKTVETIGFAEFKCFFFFFGCKSNISFMSNRSFVRFTNLPFFFFLDKKLSIELKLKYNKAKRAAPLQAIHVDQISHYWRRHTSPYLVNIITSSKTGKLMRYLVIIPFHVPDLLAVKPVKKT